MSDTFGELPAGEPGEHEIWLPIARADGYEVSNLGRVRVTRYLKPSKHPKFGHLRVSIRGQRHAVHSLVLEAFTSPRPPGMLGLHNDGDPSHNWRGNLRWGTHKENHEDRERHGRTPRGSRNGKAKLTDAQVVELREARERGESQVSLAARYGIHPTTVREIVHRRSYR